MEDFMTLNEAAPYIKKYLSQDCLAYVFKVSRQTISKYQNNDINDLSFGTAKKFMKLEEQLRSMCESLREED
jgi:predicted transcriptional regulator